MNMLLYSAKCCNFGLLTHSFVLPISTMGIVLHNSIESVSG